ncbi:MAG: oxidoreductase [Alphaproteobacteria bacterium]|nr:oxidoreductase [Alphaproteobacteria bacterium]MBU1513371.1 oxidoreductase [Alphaproteobacteria bacterium]MBU2096363.1 oxidoreductase [Alphaproteobacteria bacterium]MBU2149945.1 oxidoreductase [Alphaproteobacteria bacterium]MBU2309857.1 oxidoreductase [Alphaproteobacteria bacterium]
MWRAIVFSLAVALPCAAQAAWTPLAVPKAEATLRAVGVTGPNRFQVSGSKGTYAVTEDGGKTWRMAAPPGGEALDFRGLAALDAKTTILTSAGDGPAGQAKIFRTGDGGRTWSLVYETRLPGSFLDAVAFRDTKRGFVLGDPIDGRWFLLKTGDGGKTWARAEGPPVQPGEAAFAASNSALFLGPRREIWIVSGGLAKGRVHWSADDGKTWAVREVGLAAGPTAGLFGGLALGRGQALVVGGDYKDELLSAASIAIGGASGWRLPLHLGTPRLLEGVGRLDAHTLIAVGPRGTSRSVDNGATWRELDQDAFHAIACRAGTCVAAGGKGRVGVWAP